MGDETFGKEIPRTGSGFGMTHIDQLQQLSYSECHVVSERFVKMPCDIVGLSRSSQMNWCELN